MSLVFLLLTLTYFTPFSRISIVDFKQENLSREGRLVSSYIFFVNLLRLLHIAVVFAVVIANFEHVYFCGEKYLLKVVINMTSMDIFLVYVLLTF